MFMALAGRAFPQATEPLDVDVLVVDPSTDVEGWSFWTGTAKPLLVEYGSMPRGSSAAMVEARIKRCIWDARGRREFDGRLRARGLALVIEDQFLGRSLSSMITVAGARFRWEVLYQLHQGDRILRVNPLLWQTMLLEPGEKRLPPGVSKQRSLAKARAFMGDKAVLDDNMADAINLGRWALHQVTGATPW